jgi:hypothetical protein
MPVHCFEVFEFKSRFEFNCLSVFKNRNPFPFSSLCPYPDLARACLGPVQAKSARSPSPFPVGRFTSSARAAHLLFWPSTTQFRGCPAVAADRRAPPVIPDLESETDRGRTRPRASPSARAWPQARTSMRPPLGLFKGRPVPCRTLNPKL